MLMVKSRHSFGNAGFTTNSENCYQALKADQSKGSEICLKTVTECRQGLGWDPRARTAYGAKLWRHQQEDQNDLLWCKNVTSPTGGSNWPIRCLDFGRSCKVWRLSPIDQKQSQNTHKIIFLSFCTFSGRSVLQSLKTVTPATKCRPKGETTFRLKISDPAPFIINH